MMTRRRPWLTASRFLVQSSCHLEWLICSHSRFRHSWGGSRNYSARWEAVFVFAKGEGMESLNENHWKHSPCTGWVGRGCKLVPLISLETRAQLLPPVPDGMSAGLASWVGTGYCHEGGLIWRFLICFHPSVLQSFNASRSRTLKLYCLFRNLTKSCISLCFWSSWLGASSKADG